MCDAVWTPPGEEKPTRFGVIHHFSYPIEGGGEITVGFCPRTWGSCMCRHALIRFGARVTCEGQVASTRLETMLGDAAVVVHPDLGREAIPN